jgi:hypothetical protein
MFVTPGYGLEVPEKDLINKLPNQSVDDVIGILAFCRLGRLGNGDDKRFSFVHRRFNEYFVAQKLMKNPSEIPMESIPSDSRWRDALVLYCELTSQEEAKKIANFCWLEIRGSSRTEDTFTNLGQYLRAVHCLRFLSDAFTSRQECLVDFIDDLVDYINEKINSNKNIISIKLAVEAAGLLPLNKIDSTIVNAFKVDDDWIKETALRSCRNLPKLSKDLETKITNYVARIEIKRFFIRRKELLFSLSLSEGFNNIRNYCRFRIIDLYASLIGLFLLAIKNWLMFITCLFVYALGQAISFIFENNFSLSKNEGKYKNQASKIMLQMSKVYSSLEFTNFTALVIILCSTSSLVPKEFFNLIPFDTRATSNTSILDHELLLYLKLDKALLYFNILICILLLPLTLLRNLTVTFRLSYIKKHFAYMSGFIIFLSITLFLVFLVIKLIPSVFIYNFMKFSLIFFLILLIGPFLYNYLNDLIILRKVNFTTLYINREYIAQYYFRFKTKSGRLKFVRKIDLEKVILIGEWPDGNPPFVKNDEANVLLAKIEQRILGLE